MNEPTWLRELKNFIGIKSAIILEGNVDDLYPSGEDASDRNAPVRFIPLNELVYQAFSEHNIDNPYKFLFVDPLRGVTNPLNLEDAPSLVSAAQQASGVLASETIAASSTSSSQHPSPFEENRLVEDSLLVRAALTRRLTENGANLQSSVVCIFNLANRLTLSPESLSPEENAIFMNLLIGTQDAIRGDGSNINTLLLIIRKTSDVPAWFIDGNPNVRTITIPNPDRCAREEYIEATFPDLGGEAMDKTRNRLVDTTDGMKIAELDELRRLYARGDTEPGAIGELVDLYKYGIRENKWFAMAEKLSDDPVAVLKQRVKGQDRAIEKIVTVLKRSVLGLSGAQHSSDSKPKGVLFLAGPTGTGKTEMVKGVTELLFGDERSYLRFDMSEYASENSDQKLFGAPPGYVGYEQGGQLTNAVRANPFSVILFDEIEKAHPSIMDKFLQILEDGRMTDGRGNTVYFSETIIFFTSNVGISEEVLDEHGRIIGRRNIVEPGEPYEQIENKVKGAMVVHFKPEVLNRIGDNIVVFDYISLEAAMLILRSQLRKINSSLGSRSGIEVETDSEFIDHLLDQAQMPEIRENGGRGIGNLVENAYVNPLSTFLFDAQVQSGSTVQAYWDDKVCFRIKDVQ